MEQVASKTEKKTSRKVRTTPKNLVLKLLEPICIEINGASPWSVRVHNEKFYARVLHDGALGLGEAYMDKWWDCEHLDILFDKLLRADLQNKATIPFHFKFKLLLARIINFQTKQRAKQV